MKCAAVLPMLLSTSDDVHGGGIKSVDVTVTKT